MISPLKIIENLEIEKISDEASIIKIIQDILNSQPQLTEQSRNNPNVINYVLGTNNERDKGTSKSPNCFEINKGEV